MSTPIRVGIVGANADRGWARDAHIPALKSLGSDFVITAVSARTQPLADAARTAFGAQLAFVDSLALARDPGVDLVSVCVKVPEHRAVVLAALTAGKQVYCEWPLGRDLAEARELAAAVPAGRHVMIGLQGPLAPAIRQAVQCVRDGALGRLKILRVFSPTAGWGGDILPEHTYLQDQRNGATPATVVGGHTLAAMEALAGRFVEVDARGSILEQQIRIAGTDQTVERTCADHLMILGKHENGCVSTLEVASGVFDQPFRLELIGEQGWLKISGGHLGGYQMGVLRLETSFASGALPTAVAPELDGPSANVAECYARLAKDIRANTHSVPDFETAVRLSRLLAAIDRAAEQGRRQLL